VPATGKLLRVACISASHSEPKSWKASRAKAGIDIFNHSISPLPLFDASTRLTVGKSIADNGTGTQRRVLFLCVTSTKELLALAIGNLSAWEAATPAARTLHREHSPRSSVPPSHPLPLCRC